MTQSLVKKGKPRKASKRSRTPQPSRPSKAQRIASVNTQHGVLAALAPIALLGLGIAGLVPWNHFQDVLCLVWLGDLFGYSLRRFRP